jgi:hypothetical protein
MSTVWLIAFPNGDSCCSYISSLLRYFSNCCFTGSAMFFDWIYDCPVWQITPTENINKLEAIQRKGLSICLGSPAISGREAMEVEGNNKIFYHLFAFLSLFSCSVF